MNAHTLQHVLETAFTWTWQISLRATVVIAFVLLVQFVFRKILTPRWSYALGLLMLLRLVLPFAPASPLSVFNLGSRFAARPAVHLETQLVSPMPSPVTTNDFAPAAIATPATTISIASPVMAVTVPVATSRPKFAINYHLIAAVLWLAGCVGMLTLVARRHRRFVLALRRWEPVREPCVLGLLGDCQAAVGVKSRVTLVAAAGPGTPALFGIINPRLLIPADILRQLDDRELRHILLHELIHLRRGDVLLNWVMILVRSLHWFNPAVWLAMKKLRADQELACDAAVMARLAADERRRYGGTLLKLLGDFSAARLTPGFVPFITNKRTIKRRIVMISTFKPAGRLAVAASLALLLALGCFTFTRAAEQVKTVTKPPANGPLYRPLYVTLAEAGQFYVGNDSKPINLEEFKKTLRSGLEKNPGLSLVILADKNASMGDLVKVFDAAREMNIQEVSVKAREGAGADATKLPGTSQVNSRAKPISDPDGTSKQLNLLNEKLRHKEDLLNALRLELGVPSDVVDGNPPPQSDPETMRHMKELLIDSEVKLASQENLLKELRKLKTEALPQVLPTVVPDQILNTLLQDKNAAESTLVKQGITMGDASPDVQTTKALIDKLNSQIDVRVKGIMQGIETQITSSHAQVDNLQKKMDETREHDLESVQKYQPYIKARQELAETQRALDNVNDALMKYPRGSPVLQDLIRKALENK